MSKTLRFSITSYVSLLLCRKSMFLLSLFLITALSPHVAHSSLSATTSQTIQGTRPYFTLNGSQLVSTKELAGFKYPDATSPEGVVNIDTTQSTQINPSNTIIIPSNVKESDLIAVVDFTSTGTATSLDSLVKAKTSSLKVDDEDGDASSPEATGEILAVLKRDGVTITPSNDRLLPCSDYTIDITINPTGSPASVSARTTYGDPRESVEGSYEATKASYKLKSNRIGICYLKPQSMQTNTGTAGSTIKYANGYNSAVWEAGKGFKRSAGFPTTGFEKAVFNLIGSGSDQSKYRCTTTAPASAITLSGAASSELGANCTVTYTATSKAQFGTPTITMEYNNGSNWIVIDSYTIPNPSKWAVGKGLLTYGNTSSLATSTQFPALNACSGTTVTWQQAAGTTDEDKAFRQTYLFRRDELTNSPYANSTTYPEGSNLTINASNYFSRDVDGTFMGEWGYLYQYTGSGWAPNIVYWTAEAWSTNKQFRVSASGIVYYVGPSDTQIGIMCRAM